MRIADGDADIRGWTVQTADGKEIGTVHDLIVDMESMKVRYLEARIYSAALSGDHDRYALVPIASAVLDDDKDVVYLNAAIVDAASLSPSDREALIGQASTSASESLPVVHSDEARFFGQRRRGREGVNYLSPVDAVRRAPNELP
ncbi:MAG: PRC-barrel domain-containing protein [Gemmatimonas sp.]